MKTSEEPVRRPRADALRNRERLLLAAKAAFAESGPEASLEEIARRAGVGIGTLYRHFPSRDDVVEAVYRREVEQLSAAADQLIRDLPPAEALRSWLHVFIDYMAAKKVIAPALGMLPGGTGPHYENSGSQMRAALGKLLENGIAAGAVRPDLEVADMMQALAGISYGFATPGWQERALRLIDILIAGLRPDTAGST